MSAIVVDEYKGNLVNCKVHYTPRGEAYWDPREGTLLKVFPKPYVLALVNKLGGSVDTIEQAYQFFKEHLGEVIVE